MNKQPLETITRLNLPSPDAIHLKDAALSGLYRQVCLESRLITDNVVLLNPDLHNLAIGWEEPDSEWQAKLNLLMALWRPNADEYTELMELTGISESFLKYRAESRDEDYDEHVGFARGLWQAQQFRGSHDSDQIAGEAPPSSHLFTIDVDGMFTPAASYSESLFAVQVSQDWAILLHRHDAEESPAHALPTILGYARIDNLARNVVDLLAAGLEHYGPYEYFCTELEYNGSDNLDISHSVALAWCSPCDPEGMSTSLAYLMSALSIPVFGFLQHVIVEWPIEECHEKLIKIESYFADDAVNLLNNATSADDLNNLIASLFAHAVEDSCEWPT